MTMAQENPALQEQLAQLQQIRQRLLEEVRKVIVGQEAVLEHLLVALLAQGHVLLEGVPGVAKTLMVKVLAHLFQAEFKRIQFTPDLMPSDILGTNIYSLQEKRFHLVKGPLFTQMCLADEINRATPKTQSALLEAMQEGSVTVSGKIHRLSQPFLVLATQNPLEMEGTYPLPEAQLDRFLYKINVPFPTLEELSEVIDRTTTNQKYTTESVMNGEELLSLREIVRSVPVAEPIKRYGLRLVLATQPSSELAPNITQQYVQYGASPRGAQAIILGAKVNALLAGRGQVDYEDIRHAAFPALRHRILLNFEGEAEGLNADRFLQQLLEAIPDVDPKLRAEAR